MWCPARFQVNRTGHYSWYMQLWDDRVLPLLIDRLLSIGPVMKERQRLCERLSGKVLELGFGSGLNIEKYADAVESVAAVEPSNKAWELSEQRRTDSSTPIVRSGLDGQKLAETDGSFDMVLTTFTLCTIPDVGLALEEARRVLKPGGRLVFLEHGLAPDHGVARWQRRLEPLERKVAGGCHLAREIPELLTTAGFRIDDLEERYLLTPKVARPWGYVYSGIATSN